MAKTFQVHAPIHQKTLQSKVINPKGGILLHNISIWTC